MIDRISIASHAERDHVVLPIGGSANGSPCICLTLRRAGDMWGDESTRPARRDLFASLEVSHHRVRLLRQIHSTRVVAAEDVHPYSVGTDEPPVEGDALVTGTRDLVLAVRVADCYPIFLFDRKSGAFAVAHSGWRGTGIALESLDTMARTYGTRARDVAAVVGPGIGSCCYDVPAERAEMFRSRFGEASVNYKGGRAYLDLMAANLSLLKAAGVRDITAITDCTSCSPFLGSYRREGPEHFTHMLALIGYFG